MIPIWIGCIHCEIVSGTPHSSRTKSHIKSFFSSVDKLRISRAGSVIKHLVLWDFSLRCLEIVDLSWVCIPRQPILNPFNFVDSGIRQRLFEILLDTLPLGSALLYLVNREVVTARLNFINIFPMFRKRQASIIRFFEELFNYCWLCFMVSEPNKYQRHSVTKDLRLNINKTESFLGKVLDFAQSSNIYLLINI